MYNPKKEAIKKNIFLVLSIFSAFVFVAGLLCTVMGDSSPIDFIANESPVKLIVPPALIFFVSFPLYRKSKKSIEESTKQ